MKKKREKELKCRGPKIYVVGDERLIDLEGTLYRIVPVVLNVDLASPAIEIPSVIKVKGRWDVNRGTVGGKRVRRTQEEWIEILDEAMATSDVEASKKHNVRVSYIQNMRSVFRKKGLWFGPGESVGEVREGRIKRPEVMEYRCQNEECGRIFKSNLPIGKARCPYCQKMTYDKRE